MSSSSFDAREYEILIMRLVAIFAILVLLLAHAAAALDGRRALLSVVAAACLSAPAAARCPSGKFTKPAADPEECT